MTRCLNDFDRISGDGFTVFHGSNLDVLPFMADNSVDSIVTDPPYELGFMGKKWDSTGIAYSVELWRECLRVLKPGGHLLAFGGSRTWHRIAVAIEDAGFDVRDSIAWMYGSGFPKSLDVSKAIDKAAGAVREVVGEKITGGIKRARPDDADGFSNPYTTGQTVVDITAPATDEAKQWAGWGTALKPAFEPVVVARKPLIGTVAENVLTWGVGGLNIDGSRIGWASEQDRLSNVNAGGFTKAGYVQERNIMDRQDGGIYDAGRATNPNPVSDKGRWPANIILDEYTAGLLDEQSGDSVSRKGKPRGTEKKGMFANSSFNAVGAEYNDAGGASRFFYVAKASKRDRNEGLDGLEAKYTARDNGFSDKISDTNQPRQNFHPTVKPTDLMRYLIKLVTPSGGTVLDPFTGSGSTGKAALLDGYQFVGIELTPDYLPIIEGRLNWAANQATEQQEEKEKETKETLF